MIRAMDRYSTLIAFFKNAFPVQNLLAVFVSFVYFLSQSLKNTEVEVGQPSCATYSNTSYSLSGILLTGNPYN